MATIPVRAEQANRPPEGGAEEQFLRVIVADSQAIFRAGLRKIFALEDDIRVVGQAETMAQALAACKRFSSDLLILESSLAANPAEAIADLMRQSPEVRVVVVTPTADEELTLELFRRGAHAIVARDIEPEMLVDCVRRVSKGDPWLDSRAIYWVLEAYRTQGTRPLPGRTKAQLTPKESMIVSCVTQGMKNKEIALRVGTTEQVVKNYLRKVYDKLGVADRLELALYCLNNRVGGAEAPPAPTSPTNGSAAPAALAAKSPETLS
ncbi:MAG TPA: response regulator transcription factor [Terriglobales bacterium]|nr:response regulator transcription factor [Terriglobales bacterium]